MQSRLWVVLSLLSFFFVPSALAAEYEIVKQKQCNLLVTPSDGLSVGQTGQAETSGGRSFSFRVSKKKSRNAILVVSGRSGKCPRLSGSFTTSRPDSAGQKKFTVGLNLDGGLFTFRQPFTPAAATNPDGTQSDQQPQTINGLSGFGFSGGVFLRYIPNIPVDLELGVSYLSAATSGKTQIADTSDYVVTAKFSEVLLQPALSVSKCINARLFCKVGGIFAMPLKSTIAIKSAELTDETSMKYSRMGGELAAGLNLGSTFTVLIGGQFASMNGSFQFTNFEPSKLQNSLSGFIFGGLLVSF